MGAICSSAKATSAVLVQTTELPQHHSAPLVCEEEPVGAAAPLSELPGQLSLVASKAMALSSLSDDEHSDAATGLGTSNLPSRCSLDSATASTPQAHTAEVSAAPRKDSKARKPPRTQEDAGVSPQLQQQQPSDEPGTPCSSSTTHSQAPEPTSSTQQCHAPTASVGLERSSAEQPAIASEPGHSSVSPDSATLGQALSAIASIALPAGPEAQGGRETSSQSKLNASVGPCSSGARSGRRASASEAHASPAPDTSARPSTASAGDSGKQSPLPALSGSNRAGRLGSASPAPGLEKQACETSTGSQEPSAPGAADGSSAHASQSRQQHQQQDGEQQPQREQQDGPEQRHGSTGVHAHAAHAHHLQHSHQAKPTAAAIISNKPYDSMDDDNMSVYEDEHWRPRWPAPKAKGHQSSPAAAGGQQQQAAAMAASCSADDFDDTASIASSTWSRDIENELMSSLPPPAYNRHSSNNTSTGGRSLHASGGGPGGRDRGRAGGGGRRSKRPPKGGKLPRLNVPAPMSASQVGMGLGPLGVLPSGSHRLKATNGSLSSRALGPCSGGGGSDGDSLACVLEEQVAEEAGCAPPEGDEAQLELPPSKLPSALPQAVAAQ